MQKEFDEYSYENMMKKKYDKLYKEMLQKGDQYFETGFELYYLSMAYTIMIVFMQEEKYEECSVIRNVIHSFMLNKPGSLEISIRNMKRHQEEILRNQFNIKNGSNK